MKCLPIAHETVPRELRNAKLDLPGDDLGDRCLGFIVLAVTQPVHSLARVDYTRFSSDSLRHFSLEHGLPVTGLSQENLRSWAWILGFDSSLEL